MKNIWLIGAGGMAREYYKVLRSLAAEEEITVIGRGGPSALDFEKAVGARVVTGGLDKYLDSQPATPDLAVVSVGAPELAAVTRALVEAGGKTILLEKPGGMNAAEISALAEIAGRHGARVVLAYNRRFYESVRTARRMIETDGGPSSFAFEFTEWSHVIAKLDKQPAILDGWLLANSTHVIDLAFHLGGSPARMSCFVGGRGRLGWHPAGAAFCGAGTTQADVPFSYQADWAAPGRWAVEIMTAKHRYIFRPLEKLHIQKIGGVTAEELSLNDQLDQDFKPGLYRQMQSCLAGNFEHFADLTEQVKMAEYCNLIAQGRQL
jgi:predicted dehydrogenase